MTENIEKNFSNYEIKDKDIVKKEYNQILDSMKEVKETFKKLIKEDNNLTNNFKNKNVDFTNINIAGVLLAGIDMRNMSAKNEN